MRIPNIEQLKKSIYLAGSFSGFRDDIIKALPGVKFIDPAHNRQHAMWATNSDDLFSSIYTPSVVACFLKGKPKGTMTFVELGAAYDSGSEIIVADENGHMEQNESALLLGIANHHFGSIKPELIDFLRSYHIPQNYVPKEGVENLGKVKTVYMCGNITDDFLRMQEKLSQSHPERRYIMQSDNVLEDYEKYIDEIDYVTTHYPAGMPTNRPSCFMLGAVTNRMIPIILCDERPYPYPPISALQRRTVRNLEYMTDYFDKLENASIEKESLIMYEFFKKYDGGA